MRSSEAVGVVACGYPAAVDGDELYGGALGSPRLDGRTEVSPGEGCMLEDAGGDDLAFSIVASIDGTNKLNGCEGG